MVTVKEGQTVSLDFKPVYRYKTRPTRIETYMKGVSHYNILVNGTLAAK